MPRVPVALIRRLCYPSTYRLPKLERLQFPAPKAPIKPAPSAYDGMMHRAATTIALANGKPPIPALNQIVQRMTQRSVPGPTPCYGNLNNEEYRFWAGHSEPEYSDAQCRWCSSHFRTADQRKQHHADSDCRENLMVVVKLLRHDKNCVCCDDRTTNAKWGIPLCDEKCENEWRYSLPGAFRFAVDNLKRDMRKRPVLA